MAESTIASGYDIKVEDAPGSKKKLTITVPASMIDDKIESSMGTLANQAALPGFRKGRAPKSLLERRFGESVRAETKGQLIAEAYSAAVQEHEIKAVGDPVPITNMEELELKAGSPLTFEIEVEVVPQFELPELEGIEILKPVLDVTDEHVEMEVTRQCTQLGDIQPIDGDWAEGDRILGPGTATKEGEDEPFFTHPNVDVIVPGEDGEGQVLGLLISDLGKRLKKIKVGDTLTIETVGPDSHELEHIRGKKLTLSIEVREGQHIEPAPPERVMDNFGLASVDILKEQVRAALEQRRDEEQRGVMREQVCEHLSGAVDFDLPQRLSEAQAGRMLERYRLELLYRGGLSVDDVERKLAEVRGETETQSRQRLKLSFLLHALAEHFSVEVSEQEVNGRIATIAMQRGMRPEKLRNDLIQSGGIQQIASQIREHKAADRVIDAAEVKELPADEWNEKIRERQALSKK